MHNNSTLNPYDTCEQIFNYRNRPDQLNPTIEAGIKIHFPHQCFTQKYNRQEAMII